jgi:hypothetical protein
MTSNACGTLALQGNHETAATAILFCETPSPNSRNCNLALRKHPCHQRIDSTLVGVTCRWTRSELLAGGQQQLLNMEATSRPKDAQAVRPTSDTATSHKKCKECVRQPRLRFRTFLTIRKRNRATHIYIHPDCIIVVSELIRIDFIICLYQSSSDPIMLCYMRSELVRSGCII